MGKFEHPTTDEVAALREAAATVADLLAELLSGYPWMQGEWSHRHCDEDGGGNHHLDDDWFGRDAADAIAALRAIPVCVCEFVSVDGPGCNCFHHRPPKATA
jgi:hypothetical protein